jgi:hypothetical protein
MTGTKTKTPDTYKPATLKTPAEYPAHSLTTSVVLDNSPVATVIFHAASLLKSRQAKSLAGTQ